MSRYLKLSGRDYGHIVTTENGTVYYVDSDYTFDQGYETMVFNTLGEPDFNIYGELKNVDWTGIYTEHYKSEKDNRISNCPFDMSDDTAFRSGR